MRKRSLLSELPSNISALSLTSRLDGIGWLTPRPAGSLPGEWHGTLCIGESFGPIVKLERCGKPHASGIEPRTVLPIASRYTNWANSALNVAVVKIWNIKIRVFCPRIWRYTEKSEVKLHVLLRLVSRRSERSLLCYDHFQYRPIW